MFNISYAAMVAAITIAWILIRVTIGIRDRRFCWTRELQLLLVYICIIVVVRFTFCPFEKVDGRIQPLVFDTANWFAFRINWIPIVNLMDYPDKRDILLNVIGNTAMFVPLGIVWPSVFRKLDTHGKVIASGVGVSLLIEILQLPFYDRVTDIDDLLLNSLGFLLGYGIYLLPKAVGKRFHN